ncbi:hypothetical protein SCHIN_v1c09340 [Spiroplasma chinense]|uniref:Uncharacterized protein n=1 Tax=Spiroplasma chinense TaxID=216932 RepID=A0A5B9Y753_9MOLU|nr:hypothetical protein [Spiroplasma chinense]QEH62127.1 hypothetical protein SCHIN_v1c09340 [Spiroplasma chinense]
MSKGKKTELFDYQPSNPRDPKMPTLTVDFDEQQVEKETESWNPESNFESSTKKEVESKKPEVIGSNNKAKQGAKSIIDRLKAIKDEAEGKPKEKEGPSELVMPDPNSENRLYAGYRPSASSASPVKRDAQTLIKNSHKQAREKLKPQEIEKIVKFFKHKVVKINRTEVVLKNNKYGFEIYNNNVDGRWWVAATCHEELWNPRKQNYISFWSGNTFIGYGQATLKETLEKAEELMNYGRTGNIIWKDFAVDWNEKGNRFIASNTARKFTWKEYQKIVKWYDENKIWILVKQQGVVDYEDLMNETKAKKARGEKINPMTSVQAKLLDPPRKAQFLFGYPVKDPKYKGEDYANPENKLYEIGFAYAE